MSSATLDTLGVKEKVCNQLLAIWPLLVLGILCFLLFFYGLDSYPLIDPDEPRYVQTTREMFALHSWITPYFNTEIRLDKPILLYWMIALSYKIFGVSVGAARIVSATAGSGLILIFYLFSKRFISTSCAWMTSLILATSGLYIALSRLALCDMLLCFFLSTGCLSLYLTNIRPSSHRKWLWLTVGILLGLGTLTKGPVAVVIPFGIVIIFASITRQFKAYFLTPYVFLGAIAWAIITLPWFLLAWLETGPLFINVLFFNNTSRFLEQINVNSHPWFYYLEVLSYGFIPWVIFLPLALYGFTRYIYPLTQQKNPHAEVGLLGLIWGCFVLVFFSMAQTKLLPYILPAIPGFALLIGATTDYMLLNSKKLCFQKLLKGFSLTAGVFSVGLIIFLILTLWGVIRLGPLEIRSLMISEAARPALLAMSFLLLAGLSVFTWLLHRQNYVGSMLSYAIMMVAAINFSLSIILPNIRAIQTQYQLISFLKETDSNLLGVYGIDCPSLVYHANRHIEYLKKNDTVALRKFFKKHPSLLYIILRDGKHRLILENVLKDLNKSAKPIKIYDKYMLLRVTN